MRNVEGQQPGGRIGITTRRSNTRGQWRKTVKSAEQVSQFIRDHKGQPITLRVQRQGQQLDITATPRRLNANENRERLSFLPTKFLFIV